MPGGQDFSRTIAQWVQQQQAALQGVMRQSIAQLCDDVIEGTEVETGNLRKQWQPSWGAPALSLVDDSHDPSRQLSVVLARWPEGQTGVFYMTNNAAYAMRMEYGFVGPDSLGRVYNQKGDFNVTNNIARWPIIVANQARALGLAVET